MEKKNEAMTKTNNMIKNFGGRISSNNKDQGGRISSNNEDHGDPIPSEEECMEILSRYGTPKHVVAHCVAVKNRAVQLWERLKRDGHPLNLPLIVAGALLHDIARTENDHAKVGADVVRSMGYEAVADIIEVHMHLGNFQGVIDEKALVFAADKLVIGDKKCTLEDRYYDAIRKHPEKLDLINRRKKEADRVLREIL